MLTTEVLFLDLRGDGPQFQEGLVQVADSFGLDARSVVNQIADASGVPPTIVGFAVESRPEATTSRHRAPDGSELLVDAHDLGNGVVVEATDSRTDGVTSKRSPIFVPVGSAVLFKMRWAGRSCAVVVHTTMTEGSREVAVETASQLHEVFLDRVRSSGAVDLVGLKTDWPTSSPTHAFPEMVRRLTGDMLMSTLLSARR